MVFVVLGVAVLIFTIMYFTPGDPAQIILGASATDEQIFALRENMGLNQPFLVQLLTFLKNTFLHLDFGTSYITRGSVSVELFSRMPRTLTLAIACMVISTIIGIPLGVIAATHQDKWQDRVSIALSLIGVSIPGFWLALMLILVFSVKLGWLPAYGIGGVKYYILPCIANSIAPIAINARQTRSSMLDVIRSDYVTTALAKGVSQKKVIYTHALPNALIPIITVIGGNLAGALGGTVIIESIFSIPGIGLYLTNAIGSRDYPVVRGSVVVLAIAFSLIMLIVDLVYAFVDPRIKAQYAGGKR